MKIGPYEVKSVLTGTFALDGGAMFGTVPKVLWEKTNPADEKNRIQMEARCLLLISEKHKVLIDVGLGNKFDPKFNEIYKLDQSQYSLETSLGKYGLNFSDITDVILTHLHFDHAGGSTEIKNGKLQPTFKNAKYYVQKGNLDLALNPNMREKASYLKDNFVPLIEAGVLKTLDGDVENLLPEVSVYEVHGHTMHQQMVRVGKKDSADSITYCGDTIPTSSHIRLPFVMGYDLNPLLVMEEKNKILDETAASGGMIFFEHDPYMDAARIKKQATDYAVAEKVTLN